MEINATQVKELREATGLGMMLCKKALIEANGNMELAIENLRKQGQMTAAKRAGKVAKEGKVSIVSGDGAVVVYECNSETDFVARNDDFIGFSDEIGKLLIAHKPASMEAAKALTSPAFGGRSVEARLTDLIAKIGESLFFRRFKIIPFNPATEKVATYIHGNGKIGVIVVVSIANPALLSSEAVNSLGKDLAMQVAASKPIALDRASVPAGILSKEKEIYLTQAQSSGKPEKIWDKIVEGKLNKFFKDSTLMEQPFIRDPETSVTDRVKAAEKEIGSAITVKGFTSYVLGEEE
jgi:elongation factor Ts